MSMQDQQSSSDPQPVHLLVHALSIYGDSSAAPLDRSTASPEPFSYVTARAIYEKLVAPFFTFIQKYVGFAEAFAVLICFVLSQFR